MRYCTFLFLLFAVPSFSQINLNQGLILHHTFSGNASDQSGNSIDGTVNNATLTTDRNGVANSAYYFNGTNSYIQLPYSDLYNFSPQESFTISVWVLPEQGQIWPAQAVVVKSPAHPDFTRSLWNYGIYTYNNLPMSGYAYNHVLNGTTAFGSTQCWYNLISTYSNGIWNLYVNGKLESSDYSQTKFILQTGSNSRIAFGKKGDSFGDWYRGKMDDVRIYNRVLTSDEIDSLSFNGVSIQTIDDTQVCKGKSVQLTASGASNYSWSPVTGLTNPATQNPMAAPLVSTTYYVTGTNSFGCPGTDSVLITVNPNPVTSITNDTLVCVNSPLQLVAGGGISYSWSPGSTLSNNAIYNPVATPTNDTKYYVVVTDVNQCSTTDSVTVQVRVPENASINSPISICKNDSVQLFASGGDIYSWSPLSNSFNPLTATPIVWPDTTTIFSVEITDTICSLTDTLFTTVTIDPLPVLTLSKSNDIDCSTNSSQLFVTGASQYLWNPSTTLNNPLSGNPIASPITQTTYWVIGTDDLGCSNTDSITVFVNDANKGGYLMANAFTPNNDGINDCYGIQNWGIILELEFSIYNRWGERVFFTTNPAKCWDGTYKGKLQDPNMFTYQIKAKTSCENYVFRKGLLSLIR